MSVCVFTRVCGCMVHAWDSFPPLGGLAKIGLEKSSLFHSLQKEHLGMKDSQNSETDTIRHNLREGNAGFHLSVSLGAMRVHSLSVTLALRSLHGVS